MTTTATAPQSIPDATPKGVRPMPGHRSPGRAGLFRVVVGFHLGDGPKGCRCDHCAVDPKNHRYQAYGSYRRVVEEENRKRAKARPPLEPLPILSCAHYGEAGRGSTEEQYENDLVRSEKDLAQFDPGKFERVQEGQAQQQASAPEPMALEKLTLRQLLQVAEDEGVKVPEGAKKEHVIAAIRAAQK